MVIKVNGPGQAQLVGVLRGDLVQWAEALFVIGAAVAEPLATVLLTGNDGGLVDLCGDGQRRQQGEGQASENSGCRLRVHRRRTPVV
ncbi:hypothetical protein D3C81_1887630 [compost metagenome]